ncbi:hypothetical protein GCM10023323_24460 [Streptomyces thinghirensis]|uniref:Uncharacterized protein n=1 Tax=Streptomyces thinghirensis TaxID=551547 RepID=A0ABP9T007_9ACTN
MARVPEGMNVDRIPSAVEIDPPHCDMRIHIRALRRGPTGHHPCGADAASREREAMEGEG